MIYDLLSEYFSLYSTFLLTNFMNIRFRSRNDIIFILAHAFPWSWKYGNSYKLRFEHFFFSINNIHFQHDIIGNRVKLEEKTLILEKNVFSICFEHVYVAKLKGIEQLISNFSYIDFHWKCVNFGFFWMFETFGNTRNNVMVYTVKVLQY